MSIYDGETRVATLTDAGSHAELRFHTGIGYFWLRSVEAALLYLEWLLDDMRISD